MGINVFATCDSCGLVARIRLFTATTAWTAGQAKIELDGREYLLPEGWSAGNGPCFCSPICVDKYEAESVIEEIRKLQVKLEQIQARAIRNTQRKAEENKQC